MADYTAHIPRNWDWWHTYEQKMGEKELIEYSRKVYMFFMQMKPGSFFSIEKNVKENNRDLFIKLCCMFIDEISKYQKRDGYFELNDNCTELRYISLPSFRKIKLNGKDRRPLQKD